MPYTAEISRANPTCFLFVVDQSGSMFDGIDPTNSRLLDQPIFMDGRVYTHFVDSPSKAQVVADALNRILFDMIIACTKGEDLPRDYFQIGVIGYGEKVRDILPTANADVGLIRPLSVVAQQPLRIEDRVKKVDVDGRLRGQTVQIPVWVDPVASGGTPMCKALDMARDHVGGWLRLHPRCHPPAVIHITDGESEDGDPLASVRSITALASEGGSALVYNLYITADFPRPQPIVFPDGPVGLPSRFAQQLFTI